METLMKEINKILEAKNTEIDILRWEKSILEKEIEKLKKENEANRV